MSRRVDDSYEVVMERLRRKVYRELDNHDSSQGDITDFHVIHTFDDVVIVRDEVSGKMYEVPYMRGDTEVYLGQPREVENVYVQKKLEEAGIDIANKGLNACELTGPIVMKNASKRIAYAAVLVPGEPDSDGEVVTNEKIEQAAHEWMQSYRNVDLQHTLNNVAVPVESYILPMDMEVDIQSVKTILPAGTWVLASKVLDNATWDKVVKGELTGYSVMGIKRTTLESAIKGQDVALKKTLLKDLGPDWVAAAVSIVDEPAVPKAKFFALKSKEPENKSLYQKIKDIFAPAPKEEVHKAGRRFSDSTFSKLKQAYEAIEALIDEAEKERESTKEKGEDDVKPEELKKLIDEAVKSAVEPIHQELEALKSNEDEDKEEEGFETQILNKIEELENKIGKKSASPKSLKGQDGEYSVKKSTIADRDIFGRKRIIKGGRQ